MWTRHGNSFPVCVIHFGEEQPWPLLWPPPRQGGQAPWGEGSRRAGLRCGCEGPLAHLHVGRVEVPERGEGGRQPFGAVPDPQGLEVAGGDPGLLTEALGQAETEQTQLSVPTPALAQGRVLTGGQEREPASLLS